MNRALANPANLAFELTHVAKTVAPLGRWGAPVAAIVGWLAWPALTPAYKEETFGIVPPVAPGYAPADGASASSGSSGLRTYKYVKNEIGERPSLEED
ncbi:unnamed protein product [Aphanomyces euteiches]|uniref:Uncharacterized protein n=1 Tax=Aphanomyces euteiches TaxID=100861 RepID=A0A6G0XLU5_9STRA|nr:hypothetical protein Ae201684_003720 [Aphanomyces euteiches]KAH9084949.1 hypothetical protein Ae201684P_002181 [Aphanomyces euteiches]KAH9116428.1 hypothetical protein AeMF1_009619 [Aphanomyces euteiches]KAH9121598.1 hypothetical protein LEN26_010580 [Aphanomyces euteiches]KAH9145053.1 hypothetical protein AeRB84_011011 [Aphanomyces euteiches]